MDFMEAVLHLACMGTREIGRRSRVCRGGRVGFEGADLGKRNSRWLLPRMFKASCVSFLKWKSLIPCACSLNDDYTSLLDRLEYLRSKSGDLLNSSQSGDL